VRAPHTKGSPISLVAACFYQGNGNSQSKDQKHFRQSKTIYHATPTITEEYKWSKVLIQDDSAIPTTAATALIYTKKMQDPRSSTGTFQDDRTSHPQFHVREKVNGGFYFLKPERLSSTMAGLRWLTTNELCPGARIHQWTGQDSEGWEKSAPTTQTPITGRTIVNRLLLSEGDPIVPDG
jgi:hypothetical protein